MNELKQIFEEEIRRTIPSGSKDIELIKYDYQAKIIHFKYKIGRKRKKGSINLIIKT